MIEINSTNRKIDWHLLNNMEDIWKNNFLVNENNKNAYFAEI